MVGGLIDKAALREALRERRKAFAVVQGELAAAQLRDMFLAHIILPDDAQIAFYMPQADEIDPTPLIETLESRGHSLCLPCVDVRGAPLVFRAYRTGDPFRLGPMRVPEPVTAAPLAVPDIVLAPLVGFDRRGGRLGQGGGYYDRTLAALRAGKQVRVIGLAFSVQEEPVIPMADHDAFLDAIITEREAIIV